jgi:hypothetical protein
MYSLTIIAHHEQIAPQPIDELVYDYKELLDLLYNYIILSIYIYTHVWIIKLCSWMVL